MPELLTSQRTSPHERGGPPFRIEVDDPAAGVVEVRLAGVLAFSAASSLWSELRARLKPAAQEQVRVDLSGVESIDGGAMALLVQAKWDLETAGVRCELVGGSDKVQALLALYDGGVRGGGSPCSRRSARRPSPSSPSCGSSSASSASWSWRWAASCAGRGPPTGARSRR